MLDQSFENTFNQLSKGELGHRTPRSKPDFNIVSMPIRSVMYSLFIDIRECESGTDCAGTCPCRQQRRNALRIWRRISRRPRKTSRYKCIQKFRGQRKYMILRYWRHCNCRRGVRSIFVLVTVPKPREALQVPRLLLVHISLPPSTNGLPGICRPSS
jgi:hypothetical protein